MEVNSQKLKENKEWYISAVESCLILRGMSYRLAERIDAFPEIQLHYDVEVTADEIVSELSISN